MKRQIISAAILLILPMTTAFAAPITTSAQAEADVLHDGYSRVALTERVGHGWNVWATKDGLAYEVEIDGRNGSVLGQKLLDNDD